MERHAFAMKVKSGKMNDYRKKLGEIWPDLTTFLDRNKVLQFRRAPGRDSGEVVTPFVQVGTYPTRNFATLGWL